MTPDIPLGILHDLPNADYQAAPALGSSGLKKLAQSPAHLQAMRDPARPDDGPSDAQRTGTLAHCLTLEPDRFSARYAVKPAGMKFSTKDGIAWRDAHANFEIISTEEHVAAQRQAAAVHALPEVGALLRVGRPEVSAFWRDADTGVLCKCRPDWVAPAGPGVILLDLKKTQDASPAGFARAVARYRYHLQAPWYVDGYSIASGKPVLGFVFVAVEEEFPHAAAAYMLDDDAMERGRAECRRLLALYRECAERGDWPGYPNTIQQLTLPAWA